MSKELQKDDFILPGGLGYVTVASEGISKEVKAVAKNNDGSVTITIGASSFKQLWDEPEDIEAEIVEPKQLPNEKSPC